MDYLTRHFEEPPTPKRHGDPAPRYPMSAIVRHHDGHIVVFVVPLYDGGRQEFSARLVLPEAHSAAVDTAGDVEETYPALAAGAEILVQFDELDRPWVVSTSTPIVEGAGSSSGVTYLNAANNLSDLDDVGAARSHLGLGSAATHAAGDFDAYGAATAAIAALGLGSASTHAVGDFDAYGTAAGALASAMAAMLQKANDLSDLHDAATARSHLGLGTAATRASGDFDAYGAAAVVLGTSLQKASNLSDLHDVSTARTNLGLGTASTHASTDYMGSVTKLNSIPAPDGDVSIATHKLTNLADATADTDAVNRQSGDARYLRTASVVEISAPDFKVTGMTGATSINPRFGGGSYQQPTSGTWAFGDIVVGWGCIWLCVVAGTPGKWVALTPTPYYSNACPNGIFATDTTGWGVTNAYGAINNGASITRETSGAPYGTTRGKIVSGSGAVYEGAAITLSYALRGGLPYLVRCWAFGGAGNEPVQIGVADNTAGDFQAAVLTGLSTSVWKRYQFTYVPTADRNNPYFYTNTTSATACTWYISGVEVFPT